MTQAEREAALQDALDGQLDPQQLPADLQDELAATARVVAALRALPEADPPPGFDAQLRRRLRLAEAGRESAGAAHGQPATAMRRRWRTRARHLLPWAGGAVAAAVVLVAVFYGLGAVRRPTAGGPTLAAVTQGSFAASAVHTPSGAPEAAPFVTAKGAVTHGAGGAAAGASSAASSAPAALVPPASGLNVSQRKIIENASLTVRVADVGAAFDRLGTLTAATHGYVAASDLFQSDGQLHATASVRVPAADLAAFTQKVGTLGIVTAQGQSSNDVTQQYFDETGRLQALQAERAAYLGLLQKATNVADALKVQQALTDVEGQIESLTTAIQSLNNLTALATVNVSLAPLTVGPRVPVGVGPFGGRVAAALANSWQVLAAVAAAVAVAVVWAVPWLVLLAVAGGAVLAVVRIRRRNPRQPPAA